MVPHRRNGGIHRGIIWYNIWCTYTHRIQMKMMDSNGISNWDIPVLPPFGDVFCRRRFTIFSIEFWCLILNHSWPTTKMSHILVFFYQGNRSMVWCYHFDFGCKYFVAGSFSNASCLGRWSSWQKIPKSSLVWSSDYNLTHLEKNIYDIWTKIC